MPHYIYCSPKATQKKNASWCGDKQHSICLPVGVLLRNEEEGVIGGVTGGVRLPLLWRGGVDTFPRDTVLDKVKESFGWIFFFKDSCSRRAASVINLEQGQSWGWEAWNTISTQAIGKEKKKYILLSVAKWSFKLSHDKFLHNTERFQEYKPLYQLYSHRVQDLGHLFLILMQFISDIRIMHKLFKYATKDQYCTHYTNYTKSFH